MTNKKARITKKMTNKKDREDKLKYKEKDGDPTWIKQEWDFILPLDDSKQGET